MAGSAPGRGLAGGDLRANPHVLALVAMVVWGLAYVPSAWLTETWPPLLAAGARLGLAGILLLAVLAVTGQGVRPGMRPLEIAFLGLMQTTLFYGATFIGIAEEGAGIAAVLSNTDPLFVALLGALLLREHLVPAQWIGLVAGLIGVGVIVWDGAIWPPEVSMISLLIVGGAVAWSIGTITAARSVRASGSPIAIAGWQMLFGAVLLVIWSGVYEQDAPEIGGGQIALVIGLAALGSAAPLGLFYLSLRGGRIGEVSAWFFLIPVIGVLTAWPLLGETPGIRLVVGLVAVCAGLLLVLAPRAAIGVGRRMFGGGARPTAEG